MNNLIFLHAFLFTILTFGINAKNVLGQTPDNGLGQNESANVTGSPVSDAMNSGSVPYNNSTGQSPSVNPIAPQSWPDFGTSQVIRNVSPNSINSVGNGPVNSVDH